MGSPHLLHPLPFWSPAGHPKPWIFNKDYPPLASHSQDPPAEAGATGACCQGLVGGSQPPPARLGPLWKGPPLGGRRTVPPLQAPCFAGARGPRRGCWGWARLPLGEKFWVWVPSSWAHTAHAPSPCGRETPKVKKSPFSGPTTRCPPQLPRFPARCPSQASALMPLPASQTHFCSKAAISRESRMFSSGSQVLYLPSRTCTK